MIHVKVDKPVFQDAGSPIKVLYSSKVMADGKIMLIPSGKINTDEKINSFRDSCDLNIILRRLKNGDISAMDAFNANPVYGDFTTMPTTFRDVLQLRIDVERQFDSLPLDVKAKFDNDFQQYLVTAGSEDWIDKMGFAPADAKKEVIDNGEK